MRYNRSLHILFNASSLKFLAQLKKDLEYFYDDYKKTQISSTEFSGYFNTL